MTDRRRAFSAAYETRCVRLCVYWNEIVTARFEEKILKNAIVLCLFVGKLFLMLRWLNDFIQEIIIVYKIRSTLLYDNIISHHRNLGSLKMILYPEKPPHAELNKYNNIIMCLFLYINNIFSRRPTRATSIQTKSPAKLPQYKRA